MSRTEQDNINPGPGDQSKEVETTNDRDGAGTEQAEMREKVKETLRAYYQQSASNEPPHLKESDRDSED